MGWGSKRYRHLLLTISCHPCFLSSPWVHFHDLLKYRFVFAASAIDSRFEYKAQTPARYTLLLGKAFPKLDDFTIAFWMNVSDPLHPGTILSYKHGKTENLLRMMSGPTLQFEIWGQREDTEITLQPHEWYHIMWTWTSKSRYFQHMLIE